MGSSTPTDEELQTRVRQQEVVAELGQKALETDNLDQLMRDAAAAVADALGNEYCKVLELLPDGNELVLRQGVGWRDGLVGSATVPTNRDTQVGHTLVSENPVVVDDLRREDRFSGPELLTSHDIVSSISVVIGSVENPWGVLGTDATEPGEFTEHDANFVKSVANVLASALENERAEIELEEVYGRISDAFFALDEEWRFTHFNERAHELINPEEETLVGERIWEEFPEAAEQQFKAKYERAMYEQETVAFEEYYPDPLDTWFEVRAYPSESGLSVYFRDVTERKEREQELQQTERRFEAIFEDPNILVGLLDPDGTVRDINETAMEYIDADLEAVTGEPFWETPWWGEGDGVRADVKQWTERAAAGEYVDFEADLTRPDGKRYTLNGVFRPVTNDDGEVVSVVVSDRDITERKERERQLEESEQRYRTLAESFPNGVVTLFDDDLRYTLAAGQGFENIPIAPADIEGRTAREAWGDDVADVLEPVLQATLDGEKDAVELSYVGREWVIYAVPITDESGDVFAGVTMAHDITDRKERERELAKFETIVETIDDGIYVKDESGQFTMVNDAYAELTGYDRDELVGEDASLVVDEEAIRQANELRAETSDEGATRPAMEAMVQTADGDSVPAEATFATFQTGDGEEKKVGVVRDITERKEQRRQLEESERRYRTLVEHFPDGAVGLFDEDLRYTAVGGQLVDEAGIAPEDRTGHRVSEIYPDELVDEVEPYFHAALDGETNSFEAEYHDRHLSAYTLPVRNGDGDVFAGMLVVQDVTERVEREAELERALDLLDRTERIADVGGWEIDVDTKDVFWTEHIFDLLEVTADEEPPLDEALDMYHEEDKQVVEDAVEEALDTGDPFDVEVRLRTESGEVRWLRLQGAPETADGEVVSLRGAAQDITEHKHREQRLEELVEELETSNERLEQFAYAASHDLQEPLRMVSSYLQMIERRYSDELDEDGEEFIEYAVDGADRMRDMIEGLLEYSRVDTRGDPFEAVDLNTVLADVRDDLRMRIEESDAEITAESLPRVEGDEQQLRQVFQNLLDNAIEYSGDEPPQIRVSAEREEDKWMISVHDQGIGIDPDDTDRVFEVFQSLHTPDDHSGTGIGLALCERIVERHGGDIWVDSDPDSGTTFSFTLPAADGADE